MGRRTGWKPSCKWKNTPVDVVLTDYRMPKMDGLEILSLSRLKWPGTPVVVFSAEQKTWRMRQLNEKRSRGFARAVNTRCLWRSLLQRSDTVAFHA